MIMRKKRKIHNGPVICVNILLTDNKLKHDSHGLTPSVTKHDNSVSVILKLEIETARARTYHDLDVDESANICTTKDQHGRYMKNVWSDKLYTVERITVSPNPKCYKLEGSSNEYMSHELLEV